MRRLYRRKEDSVIAGVCGGLGDYLELDPVLVRLLFIFFAIFSGLAIVVYIFLWLFVPCRGQETQSPGDRAQAGAQEMAARARELRDSLQGGGETARRASLIVGGALVFFGLAFLLRNLGFTWLRWLGARTIWPLLLIGAGLALLLQRPKGE